MFDAALIETCADPSLTPAIVQEFIAAAGSEDPLAITVKQGGRLVLIPKPKTPDEALDVVRQYVGKASVRVGISQFPAGVGITDVSQLDARLFDSCDNLRLGTAMFAKVARIVTRWYGSPTSEEVLPQLVEDAVYAWKTGEFEGVRVFQAEDPGGVAFLGETASRKPDVSRTEDPIKDGGMSDDKLHPADSEVGGAAMRIDLSRIGGAGPNQPD